MKRRLLSALLAMAMLLTMVPAAFAADGDTPGEPMEPTENISVQDNESSETPGESSEPADPKENPTESANGVYVSSTGSDETGNGSEKSPYATLAKAVDVAPDGATIYVMSDLTASSLALVDKKNITIDGNNKTITRADDFTPTNDQGRGGYNPAMIEVANGSTLTLKDITLDDALKAEANKFLEQLTSGDNKDNENKVQDAIIAAYGDGKGTIILGSGTMLKNFGGMSAVRIGGNIDAEGEWYGSTLIMQSGSKIIDDMPGTARKGGVAAIWSQGGKIEMQEGSEISGIGGRAIFLEDGGIATVCGSITNITANDVMTFEPSKGSNPGGGATNNGFAGIAVAAIGNSTFTLGENGSITNVVSDAGNASDVAVMLVGSTFATEKGSTVSDIDTIGLVDSNGGKIKIGGNISNCDSKNVLFRLRGGGDVTFELLEGGSISHNETTDAGLIYRNGGRAKITIAGTIDDFNKPALFISSNNFNTNVKDGFVIVTETGAIKNIQAAAIQADVYPITIAGTITGCSGYAVNYTPKQAESLLKIEGTATIQDNNRGNAQICVGGSLAATNVWEHVEISPGGLDGNKTIDLKAFDVTLDEDYANVKLGNASTDAVNKIKSSIQSDWTVIGSNALWFQPSEENIHFTASRPSGIKNTGLFAAYIPLNEDGTPKVGEEATIVEVDNGNPIDVTLTGLTAGQSYALMFVNNNEYTLAPDDITIYTGGGQGDETYDDGGFPAITLNNSVDLSFVKNPVTQKYGNDLKKLTVKEEEYSATAEKSLVEQLADLLEASYTYEDGTVATDDSKPGEYTVTLQWKDGLTNADVRVNGNNVKIGDPGTLIVRHTQDVEEAQKGTNTYELLTKEPTDKVTHAVALAKNNSKFYTNDDTDREVDAAGIQILDDSLLKYEGEDRQRPMEEKAAEYLGAPDTGRAYRYKFHYLDLVDAYNGNAWVSASGGTTVYLPYPEGVTAENAQDLNVQVIHYKDLHREYGITGQADVEQAIAACELETMKVEYDANGLKFDVSKAGFSPFAVVWQTEAHTITATAGAGGSIDPEGAVTVAEGADQKFEITADEGYHIADVKVDGTSVQLDKDNTYTFTKVDKNHTIEATFASNGGGGGGGTTRYTLTYESNGGTEYKSEQYDRNTVVKLDKTPAREGYTFTGWYADKDLAGDPITEIKMTSNKTVYAGWEVTEIPEWLNGDDHFAYVIGYEDGTVRPQNDISRAEVATIFFRLLKDDVRAQYLAESNAFTDVAAGTWYNTAISTMAKMGVLDGYPDGSFRPDASITRAEFAVICARFDDSARESDSSFTDISGHWAEAEIERAATLGWINGYEDGTFRPDAEITRAEAMTLINRVLQRLPETADDLLDNMTTWSDVQPNAWYYLAVQEATNSHDFDRKADGVHETWTALTEAPDWEQYQ